MKKDEFSDNLDDLFKLFFAKFFLDLFNSDKIYERNEDDSTTDNLLKEYHKREKGFFSFFDDFLWNKRKFLLWTENGNFNLPPSIFNQKFFQILRNYLNFSHLDYFSIPIIGTISSGKSTFLNNFLGFNYLESSGKITTQFICIIRHRDIENPELFTVELDPRDSVYHKESYNFKKKEKIATGENEIKNKICEINKSIKDDENLSKREKSIFFYILETKLSIFEGENEKYCNMFEFMDIPGLNEMNDFFPNEIIPKITPNTQFSIFFFDATNIQSASSNKVFYKYVELLNSKINKNSLFVINKFDEVIINLENEKDIEKTKKFQIYDYIFRNFHANLNKNKIIALDSRNLKHEKNRLNNFDDFILFFANNLQINKNDENFIALAKKELKKSFGVEKLKKITKISEEAENYNQETFNILSNKLLEKNFQITDDEYKNLYQIFLNLKNKKEGEKNEEKNKSSIHKELYESFSKSFKDLITDFVGNETFITLLRIFNILLIRLYEYSIDKELKEKALNQIFHLRFHINSILKNEENKLNEFYSKNELTLFRFSSFQYEINEIFNSTQQKYNSIKNSLLNLKQNEKFMKEDFLKKMIKDVENVEPFINNRNIKLLFFSSKKSGKSSLINTIIGKNYLPINNQSNNINIIIKHSLEKTELFKCECIINNENDEFPFEQKIENYFYFKISESIAKEKEVMSKIKELNNLNLELKDSFYVLKTPMKFFDMIKINENVADKIEFIDLSSKYFNSEFNKNDKIINSLISFSDIFIYVDSYENYTSKNLNEINNLLFYFSVFNKSFNLNSFLYVINKFDLKSENENENEIDDLIGLIKDEKIQISSFSCKNVILLLDDKNFLENLIQEAKEEKNEKNNNLLNIILNKFEKFNIYKKSIQSILNSEKNENNNENNQELEEFVENLLKHAFIYSNLENSTKKIIKYFNCIKKMLKNDPVENSNEFYEQLYSTLFKSKFFLDYDFLITIENICNYLFLSFESIFDKIKKKNIIFNDLNYYEKFQTFFKKEIIDEFNNFLNFKNEIPNLLKKQENIKLEVIKKEKLIIEKIINILNNFDKIFSDNLKKNLNYDDINIQTNIKLNSFEHGKIHFDNVETQIYLGWLSMYFIKSENKEIFSTPIFIDSFDKTSNFEEFKKNYELKMNLYEIYFKRLINIVYFKAKNNIIQIHNFKNAKFEEIKENKYEFMENYMNLYQNFENIESINQIELEKRKNN